MGTHSAVGGRRSQDWSGGALFATMVPIWALTVTSFSGPDRSPTTPRGLWVALYYWSLMVMLALGCATPTVWETAPAG